jgi:hypothetical protein
MHLIEVVNANGEALGLYMAEGTETVAEVTEAIKTAYEYATVKKQHYLESNYEEEIDVQAEAEYTLGFRNIKRVSIDRHTVKVNDEN